MMAMHNNDDKKFDRLVRRSLIPKGFRPSTDEAIDAMLDSVAPHETQPERADRILAKVRGEAPIGGETDQHVSDYKTESSETPREFATMYRSRGEDLPPEIKDKLREMEEKAAEQNGEGEDEKAD